MWQQSSSSSLSSSIAAEDGLRPRILSTCDAARSNNVSAPLTSSQKRKQQEKISRALTANKLQFDRLEGKLFGRPSEMNLLKKCLSRLMRTEEERPDEMGNEQERGEAKDPLENKDDTSGTRYRQQQQQQHATQGGRRELVFIRGASGTGKSALAHTLKRSVEEHGGFFCLGKYDLSLQPSSGDVGEEAHSEEQLESEPSQQQEQPLVAIASACQELCQAILALSESAPKVFDAVQKDFTEQVNTDEKMIRLLVDLFPAIKDIILFQGPNVEGDSTRTKLEQKLSPQEEHRLSGSHQAGQNKDQLVAAFRTFFHIISSHVGMPIVIVLDDLQWADMPSLDILKSLATADNISNLMMIGCYRSNEVRDDHILLKALSSLKQAEKAGKAQENRSQERRRSCLGGTSNFYSITEIEVGNLNVSDISEMLRELLNKDQESEQGQVDKLAALVSSRTRGNVFFVKAFLMMLVEDGYLKFHIGTFQWDWNISAIEDETSATPNLVDFIHSRMLKLPPQALNLLLVAACLGNRFDQETLKIVWAKIEFDLASLKGKDGGNIDRCDEEEDFESLIQHALRDSLLESSGNSVGERKLLRFVHDKVQEAVVSLIPQHKFQSLQYNVGLILYEALSRSQIDSMLFVVVRLLNCGDVKTRGKGTSFDIATLNFRAGLKAKEVASFSTALEFAKRGILHFPDEEEWSKNESLFDLAMRLYSLAAQANLGLINYEEAKQCCAVVEQQKTATPLQKCAVYKVHVDMLHQKDPTLGISLCLQCLAELGCDIPRNKYLLKAQVRTYMQETRSKYIPTIEAVMEMPFIKDPVILETMQLLERAGSTAFLMSNQDLYMYIRCRYVRLINKYGLTDDSASSLASFGNVLFHKYGDVETAVTLAELSLATQDRLQAQYYRSRTISTAYHYVLGWFRPLRSCLNAFLEAYDIGLRSGNVFSSAASVMYYLNGSFPAGVKLDLLEEDFRMYNHQLRALNVVVAADLTQPMGQLIENLVGRNKYGNTVKLTGSVMDEEERLRYGAANGLNHITKVVPRYQALACMFFGEYEKGANLVAQVGGLDFLTKYFPGSNFGQEYLPFGVCCFVMASQTKQAKYKRIAKQVRSKVQQLVSKGGVNHVDDLHILDAEFYAMSGKKQLAEESYKKAVVEAARGGFLQNAAFANERYGEYLLGISPQSYESDAVYRFREAIKYYNEWGATRKADLVTEKHKDLLSRY